MEFLRESIHGYPAGEVRGVESGGRGGGRWSLNRVTHTRTQLHTQGTHTHTVEGTCLHAVYMSILVYKPYIKCRKSKIVRRIFYGLTEPYIDGLVEPYSRHL